MARRKHTREWGLNTLRRSEAPPSAPSAPSLSSTVSDGLDIKYRSEEVLESGSTRRP